MEINTVLFDLDGTLLPMDQDVFIKSYFGRLAKKLAPHGYDAKRLMQAIYAGMEAMFKNDGSRTNEEAFWAVFCGAFGEEARRDLPLFEEFYRNEFQAVRESCGFTPEAAPLVRSLKEKGIRVVLATNPLFPAVATHSRIRWAGMEPEDFEYVTTYANYTCSKPNPQYYAEIVKKLDLDPAQCLMVGNDVQEDMIAASLGMRVFLLTPCLINRNDADLSAYPQGGFDALRAYLDTIGEIWIKRERQANA